MLNHCFIWRLAAAAGLLSVSTALVAGPPAPTTVTPKAQPTAKDGKSLRTPPVAMAKPAAIVTPDPWAVLPCSVTKQRMVC